MPLMPARTLKAQLNAGEPLLGDGAMGTCLIAQGVAPDSILTANLQSPDKIRQLHAAYLSAGAQLLTGNTFGLVAGEDWRDSLRAGLQIALDVASRSEREAGVSLSVMPRFVNEETAFLASLLRDFVDWPFALLIEAGTNLSAMQAATESARALEPELLMVTGHFTADGCLPDGSPIEAVARTLVAAGADVVGANCGQEPSDFVLFGAAAASGGSGSAYSPAQCGTA